MSKKVKITAQGGPLYLHCSWAPRRGQPRPAHTYRGARRNHVLREKPRSTWQGKTDGRMYPASLRKQSKYMPHIGKAEAARRRGRAHD